MNRILTSVVIGLLLGGVPTGQVPSSSSVEQELIKLTKDLANAVVKHDASAAERLLADDFAFTHSNGVVTDKRTEIAALVSAESKWTSAKVNDGARARIYGDVAIVTGSETFEGSAPRMTPGRKMMTMIFVKRAGQWRCVGGQFTNAPLIS